MAQDLCFLKIGAVLRRMYTPIPNNKIVIAATIASIVVVYAYFALAEHSFFLGLYYPLWIGGFGWVFIRYRDVAVAKWRRARISPFFGFMLLGYAAVLLEETIVGLLHNMTEGFSVEGSLIRIGQFWAFNIPAFTGFLVGWYVVLLRYRYEAQEIFWLAGLWSLYSERTLALAVSSSVGVLLLVLPNVITYNLILAPALVSLDCSTAQETKRWKRLAAMPVACFVASLVPGAVLYGLRHYFPFLFPPCSYISCQ